MPKRTIYKDEDGKTYYKVNLPIYLSIDMVQGLAKLLNKTEGNIIQRILGFVSHMAEGMIGAGCVPEDQKEFYINDDDELEYETPLFKYTSTGDKVLTTDHQKAGKSWTITEHLDFGV